jgi:ArsR family transcriptional regulator
MSYIYVINEQAMTSPKLELFDLELQSSAALFKALAHPARLAILNYLSESKVCMTGDITRELPLSRSTVNQHLAELREAGLIKGEISGAKVNYCLNGAKISELDERFRGMMNHLDCCIGPGC